MTNDLDHTYTAALRLQAAIRGGVPVRYGATWHETSDAMDAADQLVDWLRSLYLRNSLRVPMVIDGLT